MWSTTSTLFYKFFGGSLRPATLVYVYNSHGTCTSCSGFFTLDKVLHYTIPTTPIVEYSTSMIDNSNPVFHP